MVGNDEAEVNSDMRPPTCLGGLWTGEWGWRDTHGKAVQRLGLWRERAMLWLLILVVVALIAGMVVVLNRRGQGDPNYRPDDPRHGEQLGGPGGQWGPGGDGGF